MKFRIHNGTNEDSFIVEGDTIEECGKKALDEEARRGWGHCWSEKM